MLPRPLVVFLLVLALTLPLAACGREEPAAPAKPDEVAQDEPTEPEPEPVPEPEAPPWWPDEPALSGGLLVIIENHPDARPQSGLDRADVVYEVDIVAGITRFLALYYRQEAPDLGPIRSNRWSFYRLAQGYGLPLAHAGGNIDVLRAEQEAKKQGFPALDEIYGAGAYFHRTSDRKPPHNLYTSTERLLQGAKDFGYPLKTPQEFPFREAGADLPAGGEAADHIRIPFINSPEFRNIVTWTYAGERYTRAINGKAHVMRDGTGIESDNVVILVTDTETLIKYDEPVKENRITGEGKAYFFTGGRVYEGTWSKAAAEEPLQFLRNGEPFLFTRGQTWVEVVGKDVKFTYEAKQTEEAAGTAEAE